MRLDITLTKTGNGDDGLPFVDLELHIEPDGGRRASTNTFRVPVNRIVQVDIDTQLSIEGLGGTYVVS